MLIYNNKSDADDEAVLISSDFFSILIWLADLHENTKETQWHKSK